MKWQDAEAAIGRNLDDDYRLDLQSHEERYRDIAPQLTALFATATSRSAVMSYTRFDGAALEAQHSYRRAMALTNFGALLTSIFGAAAMAWTILGTSLPVFERLSFGATLLSIAAALTAASGAAGLYWLRHGRLLEGWMGKRAEAETHRVHYFEDILARAAEASTDTALLALEYFRRYHFDVQRSYYFHRARAHEKSAGVTLAVGAAGAFLATLSSFVSIGADGAMQAISAVGICGAAIGAYAIGREQMTQDRRNAERYFRTYSALEAITTKLDAVRLSVETGTPEAARAFATAVNEQVSNEHRQWLEGQKVANEALTRIERALQPSAGKN